MTASRGRPAPSTAATSQQPSRAATAFTFEEDDVNLGPLSDDEGNSVSEDDLADGPSEVHAATKIRRRSPDRSDLDFLTDSLAAAYEPNGNPWG